MADTETRTPQVGETVLLDGIARTITELKGGSVHFDNPASAPRAVFERAEDGTIKRDATGKKVIASGFASRAGAVGASNLDLLMTDPAVIWGVRGRVDAKRAAEGAVVLTPAEHKINEPK